MSMDIEDRALELALAGAPPTGDEELDAAVTRALADIEAIRGGLILVADEFPVPGPRLRPRPARRRRLGFMVLGVAAVALAAIASWGLIQTRSPSSHHPVLTSPRYTTDSFNYRPGGLGVTAGFPGLGYSLPELSDISASSADEAWVMGTVAWHWDGQRWRSVPLPTPATTWQLSSVSTVGRSEAWAVGFSSGPMEEMIATHPLVERWDGQRWRVVSVPMEQAGAFTAVSADAPDDVWAVGWWVPDHTNRHRADSAMRPLIAHWDGRAWHMIRSAGPRSESLSQVVALAANDVWVAGPGLHDRGIPIVRHWDGSQWTPVRAPFGSADPNFVLTATSATDAWAVGGIRVGRHVKTIAAHWDGHSWMIAPTPTQNTDSALVDVQAISPTDVWALGQSYYTKVTHNPPNCRRPCTEVQSSFPIAIYEHWNGHRWSLAPTTSARMMFEGDSTLTAAPDGSVWAAGGCYWQNILTHWNGHAWAPERHPPDITWASNWPARDRHPPKTSCLSHS